MSCEQIDAQMLDFLYGELPAGDRAAFEAHVAGCERCRREVEAFAQTRAVARAVLDQAPPAHLRARIVSAAREATRVAVPVAVPANPVPARAAPARDSLWDRLRRFWALPTLATVGALAVFLLGSRLFLNPRTTVVRGRELGSARAPAQGGEPTASSEAVPPAPATAAPPSDLSAPTARDLDSAPAEGRPQPAHAEASKPVVAHSMAHRRAGGAAPKAPVSRLMGNVGDDAPGAAAGSGSAASSPAKKSRRANAGPAAEPSDKSFEAADVPSAGLTYRRNMEAPKVAAAPAPPAALAPPPPAASPPAERRRFTMDESAASSRSAAPAVTAEREEASSAAPRASRPAPVSASASASPDGAEANVKRKAAGKGAEDGQVDDLRGEPRRGADARPEAKAGATAGVKKDDIPRAETLVQRADRLFTERRWVEAAVAYRDLLRQQPNAPDAERWRHRLAAAEAATATARPPASR